jgi:hypothetical protein
VTRWCAWCGEPVTDPLIVADVVAYHEFCWWRRDRLVGTVDDPAPSLVNGFLRQPPDF